MKVKIGDFLHRIKRPVTLEPDKLYKLVTIKLYHNGVILREQKKGKDIGSAMHEVKAGDFILSGIDARNGAFGIVPEELDGAIVTNDFWYFQLDESVISKELFLNLTKTTWFDEICRKGSDGTTQRIRLQKDKFFEQVIELPDVKSQKGLLKRLDSVQVLGSELSTEITHQQDLLKKLRQQILQDAISGKLTAEWRKKNPHMEPASELLKRIQAEKAKQGIKQKPLPPIRKEEIPFDLPDGWVWCRLGEISQIFRGKGPEYSENSSSVVLNQKCIRWFSVSSEFAKMVTEKWTANFPEKMRTCLGDVLVNSTGDGTIGRSAAICKTEDCGFAFDSHILKAQCFVNAEYISIFINSSMGQGLVQKSKGAKTTKQTELGVGNLSTFTSPLPPLNEQIALVECVNRTFLLISECEDRLRSNVLRVDSLLQSILKEAFEA